MKGFLKNNKSFELLVSLLFTGFLGYALLSKNNRLLICKTSGLSPSCNSVFYYYRFLKPCCKRINKRPHYIFSLKEWKQKLPHLFLHVNQNKLLDCISQKFWNMKQNVLIGQVPVCALYNQPNVTKTTTPCYLNLFSF